MTFPSLELIVRTPLENSTKAALALGAANSGVARKKRAIRKAQRPGRAIEDEVAAMEKR
jgi:hypothetical protein